MRLTKQRSPAGEEPENEDSSKPRVTRFIPRLVPPPDLVAAAAFVVLVAAGLTISGSTGSGDSPRAGRVLHTSPVEGLAVAPDGRKAASASRDGTVKMWTLGADDQGRIVARGLAGFSSIAFSPDGRYFIAGGFQGVGVLGDPFTGSALASLGGHVGAVRGVAFAPDGSTVATGADDCSVKVWGVPDGREHLVLRGHEAAVTGLAFAPDGRTLATVGLDGLLILWDLDTGAIRDRVPVGLGHLRTVAYAPDGRSLVLGGQAGVGLRDVATGRTQTSSAVQGAVTAVRVLADGVTLASAGWDGSVSLWDVRAGTLRLQSRRAGQGAKINALAVCPDGVSLLTGDQAGAVREWKPEATR
ncbi:MAG: WD40 repeat domain-containing protein [Isosphaeraceae bacterium]|nr:WD40 repeat domain-containing protein [Isosphaeraceae bacterium]